MIEFLNLTAFTAFGAPTSWAEVLGFVTGAWCVWLVGRQSVWNWPIGIANNVVWILLFATAGLFADSALQVVYIALAVWGWRNWVQGRAGTRCRSPVRPGPNGCGSPARESSEPVP
ncbi:nicotinamide mononucleotide transporter family protein [Prescottella defluvii]|nr:nicotinamide mononucleotide transporter family protein [Prescottella defluvii]